MVNTLRYSISLIPTLLSTALLTAAPNRLIDESSPYLQQHAHNPIDWYPWGQEAFDKAQTENKPIFLSIGYSTCHWCHIMADESFSDESVAAILNEYFVSIKVDREERPDLDQVYMTFVQAATGSGGWPLNVWLTPDRKPFYGGVYFPPEDKGRTPSFTKVLTLLSNLWREDREQIYVQSDNILAALSADSSSLNSIQSSPWDGLRDAGLDHLSKNFDSRFGGFGSGQKFPNGSQLEYLINLAATHIDSTKRAHAVKMLTATLRSISTQGLFDHVGGGFHRYTVDQAWRVPHFEKMLYDQAQISHALLSAWQLTKIQEFRSAAISTLAYVQANLTHAQGAFFSAEDAVSFQNHSAKHKTEGAFYTWTISQIADALPASELPLFHAAYGIREHGNVADIHDPQGELKGRNVLYRNLTNLQLSEEFRLPAKTIESRLSDGLALLKKNREERPRPHLDDKIVTAWNGLMISAFARAGQIFNNPSYIETARRSAEFIRERIYDETTGTLARSYRYGKRSPQGFAEDYAYLIQGLIDLYESDFDITWLKWALTLQSKQAEIFEDTDNGGFFASDPGDESIFLRMRKTHDDAEPAATSISVRNLGRLAALLHDHSLLADAKKSSNSLISFAERNPGSLPQLLAAVSWLNGDAQQALLHTSSGTASDDALLAEIRSRYHPRRMVVRIDETSRQFFQERVPLIDALPDEPPALSTAYICENFVCQMPTSDLRELREILDRVSSQHTH